MMRGLLEAFARLTAVYVAGAALYIAYVVRGPFRVAAMPKS